MSGRFRSSIAALLAVTLLAGLSLPGAAWAIKTETEQSPQINPAVDALFMRPLGFASLVVGAVLFVPAGFFTAITRPSEIGAPFELLVMRPIQYTWKDPLGTHPRR